jgi:recombination protein RecT
MEKETKKKENDGIEFPPDFKDPKTPEVTKEEKIEAGKEIIANAEAKTEVAPVAPKQKIQTWQQALIALPEKFTQLQIDERRSTIECGFAMQIIKNSQYLQQCEAQSVFDAIIYSARIGLTLNPAFGLAYLVPRKTKGVWKCVLDVGYRGWAATLKSYGAIIHIDAYVVYTDETFTWNPSTGELMHVPSFAKTEAEQKERVMHGAYAKAILPNGLNVYEFIPAWELQKIKMVSPAASQGFSPYTDWESEMTRKAPIKRLAKKLLVLQDDDRVKAMFENEQKNDQQEPKKKTADRWDLDEETINVEAQ